MVNLKSIFKKLGVKEKTIKDFIEPYSREDIIQLGKDAEDLLDNQAFNVAVENYRNQLVKAWKQSKPLQTNERESVWHRHEALEGIVVILKGMINNMIAEKKKIEQEKTLKGVR